MLLYPLPGLVTLFPDITFIIKGNAHNKKFPPFYHFPALMTVFSDIWFINEEAIVDINTSHRCHQSTKKSPCLLFKICYVLLFQPHHQIVNLNFLATLQFWKYYPYLHLKWMKWIMCSYSSCSAYFTFKFIYCRQGCYSC